MGRKAILMQKLCQQTRRKTLKCTGCPGCGNNGTLTPNPMIQSYSGMFGTEIVLGTGGGDFDAVSGPLTSESRIRAWLENVKLLNARWRNLKEEKLRNVEKTKRLFDNSNNDNVSISRKLFAIIKLSF